MKLKRKDIHFIKLILPSFIYLIYVYLWIIMPYPMKTVYGVGAVVIGLVVLATVIYITKVEINVKKKKKKNVIWLNAESYFSNI